MIDVADIIDIEAAAATAVPWACPSCNEPGTHWRAGSAYWWLCPTCRVRWRVNGHRAELHAHRPRVKMLSRSVLSQYRPVEILR